MAQFKVLILSLLGFGVLALFLFCTYLGRANLENPHLFLTNNSRVLVYQEEEGRPSERKSRILSAQDRDLVVFYNRVPKTGSTSFTGIAYDLCGKNKFNVLHLNVSKNSHILSLSDQHRFAQNVTRWTEKHPALFHGHLAFFDFAAFGAKNPVFINIVREPIDRFVSYYYFLRYGDDFRPYLSRRRQGDRKSIDECVDELGKDCDPTNMWMQVPFFCGHSAACWEPPGNPWALEQAKRTLVEKYFLVGITEEMENFVTLLEASLPSMFRGAVQLYKRGDKSHLRKTFNKTVPLPETLVKLQQSDIYRAESEFYRFANEQFQFAKRRTLMWKDDRSVDRERQYFFEKIRPRARNNDIRL